MKKCVENLIYDTNKDACIKRKCFNTAALSINIAVGNFFCYNIKDVANERLFSAKFRR